MADSACRSSERRAVDGRAASRARKSPLRSLGWIAAGVAACSSLVQRTHAQSLDSIVGTWCSGYGSVMTGPGFAQPTNFTFTYPNTTGISYSFSEDGYFEEAQYRFVSNGNEPHCPQAVVIWQHGNYTINPNNSISLSPIESDGRIQVQDPCAEQTNVITYYYEPTLFAGYAISNDLNHQRYMLQLLRFDGAFLPRMYLYFWPPQMLPTQQLWTSEAFKQYKADHGGESAASHSHSLTAGTVIAAASALLYFVAMA